MLARRQGRGFLYYPTFTPNLRKYKNFKVSKAAVKISFLWFTAAFVIGIFEKRIKYLKKGIFCVKIKIKILINAQSIGKSKYFVQKSKREAM